jgi:hypothetical protein
MEGASLFYDSYLEALRDDVVALGGPKVVGKQLFPEKEVEAARNTLNDCLNIARRERLTDEQERLIMRRARDSRGFSAALYFLCDDTGFERPQPKEIEDELARMLREYLEIQRRARNLEPAIEQARLKVAK